MAQPVTGAALIAELALTNARIDDVAGTLGSVKTEVQGIHQRLDEGQINFGDLREGHQRLLVLQEEATAERTALSEKVATVQEKLNEIQTSTQSTNELITAWTTAKTAGKLMINFGKIMRWFVAFGVSCFGIVMAMKELNWLEK